MTPRICTRSGAKWKLPRYKQEWRNICAIMPAYLPNGVNGTVITYIDGTEECIDARLHWVLEDLLHYLGSSTDVLTKRSRELLGENARRVPLMLHESFCLVPVKGREAISRSDSSTGYAVLKHVSDVIPEGAENRLYFTNGKYILVKDGTETLWRNLNITKEMQQIMADI